MCLSVVEVAQLVGAFSCIDHTVVCLAAYDTQLLAKPQDHTHGIFDMDSGCITGWVEFVCSSCTDNALSGRLVVALMYVTNAILSNGWAERQRMGCIIVMLRIKDGLHTCEA